MRMAALRLLPADDGADVFDNGLALGNVLQCEDPFAVHTGAAGLNAALVGNGLVFGHVLKIW